MRRLLPLLLLGGLVLPVLAAAPGAVAARAGGSDRAHGKAAVHSVLKQTGGSGLKGRLTSDRAACAKHRDVYLVVDDSTAEYPDILYVAATDSDGRWSVGSRRAGVRGDTTTVYALTLGDRSCRLAQSNSIRAATMRSGAKVRPAKVSITLKVHSADDADGRISSSRPGCVKFRPVFSFVLAVGSDAPYDPRLFGVSYRNGHYAFNEDGSMRATARGQQFHVITVVPGTEKCRPAQSPTVTFGA